MKRVAIRGECLGLRRRMPTRQLGHPWPFPLSVEAGRGLVKNVVQASPEPGEAPQDAYFDRPGGRVFIRG